MKLPAFEINIASCLEHLDFLKGVASALKETNTLLKKAKEILLSFHKIRVIPLKQ